MVNDGAAAYWRRDGLAPVLLLAFLLRLIWALLVPVSPVSDSSIYDIFAREIAAGHGYAFPDGTPTVYWPVGPSALYGGAYALFGTHGAVVAGLNLVMGVALVGGIQMLARRTFGARVGLIAGLLAAVWPIWIQFTTVLSSELPCALLLVASFLARAARRLPDWARVALSTALLVGAAYMRPTVLPLIVLLPLLGGDYRRPARTAWHVAIALVVAAALLAPWAQRNQALFGAPVLVSANFGANLWMGNNPASNGGYVPLPEVKTANEVTRDVYFKQRALAFIRAHPGDYLALCLARAAISFDRESIGVIWNMHSLDPGFVWALKLVSSAYWLGVLAFSLIGVALFVRGRPIRLFDPLVVAPALLAAPALLVVGQDRYHMAMMPFVAIFAASAVVRVASLRFVRAPAAACGVAKS